MNALAAIHVGRKQLGLDEDTYRAMLERVTGKASSAEMSDAERRAVLEEMRRRGFNGASKGARRPLKGPFAKKLQALWIAGWNLGVVQDRDDRALTAFVKRQTGLDDTVFLRDAAAAARAIEALKAWLARVAEVDWSDDGDLPPWMRQPGARIAVAQWRILAETGQAKSDFGAFRDFVADHAFRPLAQMTPKEWQGVMNTLGRRVRTVRR